MLDVVERFMRYVQVDSQSDPNNTSCTPSTHDQFDMAKMVADDLRELGCENVKVTDHAYVTGSYPASEGCEDLPGLGFVCHIDSSFDAPASNIKPQIVKYDGERLVYGTQGDKEIFLDSKECPYLDNFIGQDIIISDGTTLLSVDDKAAVAEVISLIHRLKEDPTIAHPPLKLAFVPDEEIGHGAKLLDLEEFGAQWAYTIDCEELGKFTYECFNASEVRLITHGITVHPGTAKDRLINALLLLEEFNLELPSSERPEHTEGYEGFYHLTEVVGTSHQATATYIVRDFDDENFSKRLSLMASIVDEMNQKYGFECAELKITPQYRNMAQGFADCQFVIDNALEAYKVQGIEPHVCPMRGGTDGAQLTLRGLPCPNIATGGALFHSTREFIAVSALEKTVDILQTLVGLYAKKQ